MHARRAADLPAQLAAQGRGERIEALEAEIADLNEDLGIRVSGTQRGLVGCGAGRMKS